MNIFDMSNDTFMSIIGIFAITIISFFVAFTSFANKNNVKNNFGIHEYYIPDHTKVSTWMKINLNSLPKAGDQIDIRYEGEYTTCNYLVEYTNSKFIVRDNKIFKVKHFIYLKEV